MGYPRRICRPNITYHVFSRCIETRDLMKESAIKDLFLEVVSQAQEKYDFEINHHVVMHNHFHFMLKTHNDEHTVSKILQYIKSVFAKLFNKIMNRIGPFWNERFKCTIVENSDDVEAYNKNLPPYIIYNPVRKGIVKNPLDYKYSSIHPYVDENYKSPIKITPSEYHMKLGKPFEERKKRFLEQIEAYRRRIDLYFG